MSVCRLVWFMRTGFLNLSLLFQVQMSIDRVLTSVFPMKFMWLSRIRNLMIITGAIVVYSACYTSIHLFRQFVYLNITSNNATGLVVSSCDLPNYLMGLFTFSFFITRLACYIAVFVSNILIIRKLIKSKRAVNNGQSEYKISGRELSFSFSLMFGNLVGILINTPYLVVLLINLWYSLDTDAPTILILYGNELYAYTNWSNYIYDSITFYLLYVSNKVFRSELKIIFCK